MKLIRTAIDLCNEQIQESPHCAPKLNKRVLLWFTWCCLAMAFPEMENSDRFRQETFLKKKSWFFCLLSVCLGLLADTLETQMGQVRLSAAYPPQSSPEPHALQPARHSSQRLQKVLIFPLSVRQIASSLLSLPSLGMYLPFNSTWGLC